MKVFVPYAEHLLETEGLLVEHGGQLGALVPFQRSYPRISEDDLWAWPAFAGATGSPRRATPKPEVP